MTEPTLPAWLDLDRLARTRPQPGWEQYGSCLGIGPASFFPVDGDNSTAKKARKVCAFCPALYACLAIAVVQHRCAKDDHGIWGRTTSRERRNIRRALTAREAQARG